MSNRPTVIVLAESFSEEFKQWGPKCLIPVGPPIYELGKGSIRRNILDWHFNIMSPDIIVTGYGHSYIKNEPLYDMSAKIVRHKQWESTNQCAGAALALSRTKSKDVVLLFGDLVFSRNLLRSLLDCSCIVTDTCKKMHEREVGVTVVDGEATQFSYGLPQKWSQIVRLRGRDLDIFREIVANPKARQWFLFEGLNAMLNQGGSLAAICNKEIKVIDVDEKKDVLRARTLIKNENCKR